MKVIFGTERHTLYISWHAVAKLGLKGLKSVCQKSNDIIFVSFVRKYSNEADGM